MSRATFVGFLLRQGTAGRSVRQYPLSLVICYNSMLSWVSELIERRRLL